MEMRDERGFTLLEMLLVITIVSSLSYMVVTSTWHHMELNAFQQIIQQFEVDLMEMQALAMENGLTVRCWIVNEKEFQCIQRYGELLISRQLPKNIDVKIYTANKRIEFNGQGTIIQFGKIEFNKGDQKAVYSINLGRGRMRLLTE